MPSEALQSTQIANLDSVPPIANTPGSGGASFLRTADGSLTATTGKTSGSTYQLLRVPSSARVKHAYVQLDAGVTTFAGDIGFYYSDSTSDGTPAANAGTKVNSTTGSQLLGAAVDLHAQTTPLDVAVTMGAAKRDEPLWQACGLTTDPHCFFDLVVTSTSTTSGAPVLSAELQYTE